MQINTSKFPKVPRFMHILPWFFQQSGKQLYAAMALDEALFQKNEVKHDIYYDVLWRYAHAYT